MSLGVLPVFVDVKEGRCELLEEPESRVLEGEDPDLDGGFRLEASGDDGGLLF